MFHLSILTPLIWPAIRNTTLRHWSRRFSSVLCEMHRKEESSLENPQFIIIRARIWKYLRSSGIDYKESIPPAYVVWWAGTITLFVVPRRQTTVQRLAESIPWNRLMDSLNDYKFWLCRHHGLISGNQGHWIRNGHFLAYIPSWQKKSAQPSEGGGARPPPFILTTITYRVVVYAPAERTDTLPYFYSTRPIYVYSVAATNP